MKQKCEMASSPVCKIKACQNGWIVSIGDNDFIATSFHELMQRLAHIYKLLDIGETMELVCHPDQVGPL